MWFLGIQINSWFWFKQDVRKVFTERIPMKIAFCMPRRVVYWCFLRVTSRATCGEWGNTFVSDLNVLEALERWQKAEKFKY